MGWKLCKVPTQEVNDSNFGLIEGSMINGRRPHTSHAQGAGPGSPQLHTPQKNDIESRMNGRNLSPPLGRSMPVI